MHRQFATNIAHVKHHTHLVHTTYISALESANNLPNNRHSLSVVKYFPIYVIMLFSLHNHITYKGVKDRRPLPSLLSLPRSKRVPLIPELSKPLSHNH